MPPFASCGEPWSHQPVVTGTVTGFELVEAPAGVQLDAGTGALSWLPGSGQGGVHRVTVRAIGPAGEDTLRLDVAVVCASRPPARIACGCGPGAAVPLLLAVALLLRRRRPR
jgi:uncharacterized protein (TIGR03382 family)